MLYNRDVLSYQYDWRGQKLQNKRLLVCETCRDEPAEFLKTLILPPDPMPVLDSRIIGMPIDFYDRRDRAGIFLLGGAPLGRVPLGGFRDNNP